MNFDKLTIAPRNQRHATRAGGYYGAIIGDVRRGGAYSSYHADLITRMPKKELQAALIKQQHHVTSNGTDYPSKLPRIMHEYVVPWQKRRARVGALGGSFTPPLVKCRRVGVQQRWRYNFGKIF